MKKSFIFMLALCSGLAFADAPQVANSIDKQQKVLHLHLLTLIKM